MGTMTVMKRPVQIDGYAPTSRRLFAGGGFSVSLSTDPDDIVDAQRLRFEVFTTAPGFSEQIGDAATRRDADRFDAYCDHLLVRDESPASWSAAPGCSRRCGPSRRAGGTAPVNSTWRSWARSRRGPSRWAAPRWRWGSATAQSPR